MWGFTTSSIASSARSRILFLRSLSYVFAKSSAQAPNWSKFDTPLTIRPRERGVDYIRERQHESVEKQIPSTPSVLRVADRVEKEAETAVLRGALTPNASIARDGPSRAHTQEERRE